MIDAYARLHDTDDGTVDDKTPSRGVPDEAMMTEWLTNASVEVPEGAKWEDLRELVGFHVVNGTISPETITRRDP